MDEKYFSYLNGYKVKDAEARNNIALAQADIALAQADIALVKQGFVTPQMFGAKADNQTDDTAAIQAAIDYVEGLGGGTVFFPAGIYVISDTLKVKCHGVKLLSGCVQSAYIRQSNIEKDAIMFHHSEDLTLSGVTINHISIICDSGSVGRGVVFDNCVNAFVENVIISNFIIGLELKHTGNSLVKAVGVATNVSGAVGFKHGNHSVSTHYVSIFAGLLDDASSTGIGFDASEGNIADFMIDYLDVGNGLIGVRINGGDCPDDFPPADIRLHEIVCDGVKHSGIHISNINDKGNVVVSGGWINPSLTSGVAGIVIADSKNVMVKDMTIQQVANGTPVVSGVTSSNSNKVSINGCQFLNVVSAISVNGMEKLRFTDNLVECYDSESFDGVAVYLVGASRSTVNNNIVSGGYSYGIIVDATSTKCIITNNNVEVAGENMTVSTTDSISENNLT